MKLRSSGWAREDLEKRNRLLQREMEFLCFFSTMGSLTVGAKGARDQSTRVGRVRFCCVLALPSLPRPQEEPEALQLDLGLSGAGGQVLTPYQEPEPHRGWSCSGSGGCSHCARWLCPRLQHSQDFISGGTMTLKFWGHSLLV